MKSTLFGVMLLSSLSAFACPKPWVCESVRMEIPYSSLAFKTTLVAPMLMPTIKTTTENIHAGYLPETGPFRGNILYFEGLGDSFANHQPLFSTLSKAGYRVIAFDYMGQGHSSGKMDRTRIQFIPTIGEKIWKKFARDLKSNSKKTIIGWSTGGLAAYMSAAQNKADRIILIAPGIAPNFIVGEGMSSWPLDEITLESLTSAAPYKANESDPHIDPIKPNSPTKVMNFAIDLQLTAKQARKTTVAKSVSGLVLLSGHNDTYVDSSLTRKVLKSNAPHFKVIQYEGALHEIDNEREDIQKKAIQDMMIFLRSTNG